MELKEKTYYLATKEYRKRAVFLTSIKSKTVTTLRKKVFVYMTKNLPWHYEVRVYDNKGNIVATVFRGHQNTVTEKDYIWYTYPGLDGRSHTASYNIDGKQVRSGWSESRTEASKLLVPWKFADGKTDGGVWHASELGNPARRL